MYKRQYHYIIKLMLLLNFSQHLVKILCAMQSGYKCLQDRGKVRKQAASMSTYMT